MSDGKDAAACEIAVVIPVLARHDAISQSAVDTWRMLAAIPGMHASLLTSHSERPELAVEIVAGLGELLRNATFLRANLLIYHFGLYHPFFDALLLGNGRAKQVVRFHNVTPSELLRPEDRSLVEGSIRQFHNFRWADAIWADSAVNAETLDTHGIWEPRTEIIPLVVDAPSPRPLSGNISDTVNILFVGRFVRSKGLLDLIDALARVRHDGITQFRLKLVGNLRYSHPSYLELVRSAVERLGSWVEILGSVDDGARDHLLHEAHILAIPSYHEGFCKPVVEALRAGCIPVGYAAHNLPAIAAGLGRLVAPGDVPGLAIAFGETIQDVLAVARGCKSVSLRLDCGVIDAGEFDTRARAHWEQFEVTHVRAQTIASVQRALAVQGRLGRMRQTRSAIKVLPDDTMREATRVSLNRLPDLSDWEAGGQLSDIMRDMRQPVTIHRKSWEYALCAHGLDVLGAVRPESIGLAVGAGSETPLFYYANLIERMVATDLYDNEAHEGTPLMLKEPDRFAPFPYRRERLEVLRMPGDALAFDRASFDFAFCLSSIEHFGSRDTQRKALDEIARVLRPGGIACIITELILTEHSHEEYFRWDEIEEIFLRHPRFTLEGGDPDLSISESLVSFPLDLERSCHLNRSPHIVLKRGDMLWTSFSMFLRRL